MYCVRNTSAECTHERTLPILHGVMCARTQYRLESKPFDFYLIFSEQTRRNVVCAADHNLAQFQNTGIVLSNFKRNRVSISTVLLRRGFNVCNSYVALDIKKKIKKKPQCRRVFYPRKERCALAAYRARCVERCLLSPDFSERQVLVVKTLPPARAAEMIFSRRAQALYPVWIRCRGDENRRFA